MSLVRTVFVTLFTALVLVAPAHAAEDAADAPEYLLGDLGVRVDLPKPAWKMTRWSDWDLKAETRDPILLQAWATEVQTDPANLDAKSWDAVYQDKLAEMGAGAGIKLESAELADVQGHKAAFLDYSFKLKSGNAAVLKGATIAVEGQMFHLALVSVRRFDRKAGKVREEVMDKLEIQDGPADVAWAPSLEGDGFSHTLPEDWRAPLDPENSVVNKQISNLGLEDLEGCWLAMRPRGPASPDAMVACQGGKLLGVVDEYSFEGIEPTVRETMFGKAEVPAAKMVQLEDRVAFVYDLGDKHLAVAVVPYDKGIVRIWVKGGPDSEGLADAIEATVKGGTYGGAHPAGIGERIAYYLTYRPFSPVVICPVLGLLLIGGGLAVGGVMLLGLGGRKDKYAELAEDE